MADVVGMVVNAEAMGVGMGWRPDWIAANEEAEEEEDEEDSCANISAAKTQHT